MEEMKSLLLNGLHRKNSTLSLRSIDSFAPSINTKEAKLYKAGARADMIRDREVQAGALFQDPNAAPVVNHGDPLSVAYGEELLEEGQKGKSGDPTLKTNSTSFRESDLHIVAELGFKQGV